MEGTASFDEAQSSPLAEHVLLEALGALPNK
jgi:hypothetical protein